MNRTNTNKGMFVFVHLTLTEHEHIIEHILLFMSFIKKMGMFVFVRLKLKRTLPNVNEHKQT
ncbi:hypothetical protein Hanom_Chr04g00347221 [Helianthus anomalus]